MEDDREASAKLRASYNELMHLLDQIPSVSDEAKQIKYFETIPPLVERKYGSNGHNVFHFAAAHQSLDILRVFNLEEKLFTDDATSQITLHPDNNGNHPFIYALVNYERGPNFQLAERFLYFASRGRDFEPQLYLYGSIEELLRQNRILLDIQQLATPSWSVWSIGLDMFRSAHLLLLPQFPDSNMRTGAPPLERRISEESLSSLHRLPLPYLSLVLLGLRLKSSLRTQAIGIAFDGQEVAVDQCLEFLDRYFQLSPNLSLASLKNEYDESIFEFTQRMYFMQVGDPLQLMRHFAFFLSWANPPREVSPKILHSVSSNPLLNPIERLNYVILLAAATAQHPLHGSEKDDNFEYYSIRDAISMIESTAAQLSSDETVESAETEENGDQNSREIEQPPARETAGGMEGNFSSRESRTNERGAEAAVIAENSPEGDSSFPATIADRDNVQNAKKEDEEVVDNFPFLPALNLLAIGNTLCEGPPSLKFLARRCVRTHLDFPKLIFPSERSSSSSSSSSAKLPKFILDYLRMKEYRNVKICLEEQKIPNSGIPDMEAGPEFLISFEKVLHLQIPVIHHC